MRRPVKQFKRRSSNKSSILIESNMRKTKENVKTITYRLIVRIFSVKLRKTASKECSSG